MKKNLILIFLWFISIAYSIIWTFENPEKIEKIKNIVKKNQNVDVKVVKDESLSFIANSFNIKVTQVLNVADKTAFVSYPNTEGDFSVKNLNIYTQKGFLINNLNQLKLELPNYFTLQRNGGIKTIISVNNKKIA